MCEKITALSSWYRVQSIFAVRHPNHKRTDSEHYRSKFADIQIASHHRYRVVCALDDYFDAPKRVVRIAPRGYGKMKHKELYG